MPRNSTRRRRRSTRYHESNPSSEGFISDVQSKYFLGFKGFDFITKFGLDNLPLHMLGVRSIRGTNEKQTAYRFTRTARLRKETRSEWLNWIGVKFNSIFDKCYRDIFPDGLPQIYSFRATFRKPNGNRRENWNLIQIKDNYNNNQFVVGLRPRDKVVVFQIVDYSGALQTLSFPASEVYCNVSIALYAR